MQASLSARYGAPVAHLLLILAGEGAEAFELLAEVFGDVR